MARRRGADRPLRHLPDRLRPARPRRRSTAAGAAGTGSRASRTTWSSRSRRPSAAAGSAGSCAGDDGVADRRGITLVIHYSLMKTPDCGYHPRDGRRPRRATSSAPSKDFGKTDADTNFVRLINRWRLEKADPRAELSPPKKQIVWYIEDTVPIEYRPYVEEGIREWNKAFEKIGFGDAIAVRWQEAGPRRVRPRGHELLHLPLGHQRRRLRHVVPPGQPADRRDDRRRRRLRRRLHPLLEAAVRPADRHADDRRRASAGRPRWPIGEVISPILAAKMGFGQPAAGRLPRHRRARRGHAGRLVPEAIPADQSAAPVAARPATSREAAAGFCQFQTGPPARLRPGRHRLGRHARARRPTSPSKDKDDKDKDKDAKKEAQAQGRAAPRSSSARRSSTS